MKVWILTKYIGTDVRTPDLKGLDLRYSCVDEHNSTCLCRVSGKIANIEKLLTYTDVMEVTDDEALTYIKSANPNAELKNVDVIDTELDDIAKTLGIDPVTVRRRGLCFHEQEWELHKEIAKKLNIDISQYEADFKTGKNSVIKALRVVET